MVMVALPHVAKVLRSSKNRLKKPLRIGYGPRGQGAHSVMWKPLLLGSTGRLGQLVDENRNRRATESPQHLHVGPGLVVGLDLEIGERPALERVNEVRVQVDGFVVVPDGGLVLPLRRIDIAAI